MDSMHQSGDIFSSLLPLCEPAGSLYFCVIVMKMVNLCSIYPGHSHHQNAIRSVLIFAFSLSHSLSPRCSPAQSSIIPISFHNNMSSHPFLALARPAHRVTPTSPPFVPLRECPAFCTADAAAVAVQFCAISFSSLFSEKWCNSLRSVFHWPHRSSLALMLTTMLILFLLLSLQTSPLLLMLLLARHPRYSTLLCRQSGTAEWERRVAHTKKGSPSNRLLMNIAENIPKLYCIVCAIVDIVTEAWESEQHGSVGMGEYVSLPLQKCSTMSDFPFSTLWTSTDSMCVGARLSRYETTTSISLIRSVSYFLPTIKPLCPIGSANVHRTVAEFRTIRPTDDDDRVSWQILCDSNSSSSRANARSPVVMVVVHEMRMTHHRQSLRWRWRRQRRCCRWIKPRAEARSHVAMIPTVQDDEMTHKKKETGRRVKSCLLVKETSQKKKNRETAVNSLTVWHIITSHHIANLLPGDAVVWLKWDAPDELTSMESIIEAWQSST